MKNAYLDNLLKERDYLPILKMNDGTPVTKENWQDRRLEMLELLREYSYGRGPEVTVKKVWGKFISSEWNCYAFKVKNERVEVFFETEYGTASFPVEFFAR